jgi:hypothetical protein
MLFLAMVYSRKTSRGNCGLDKLQEAVDKVRKGEMSKRKAETVYGVPCKMLSRHLMGSVQKPGNLGQYEKVLVQDLENALVQHTVKLQHMIFSLDTLDMRKLTFELAESKKKKHPFQNEKAIKGWLCGFLKHHPQLAIHSPEPTNQQSVDIFST